MHLDVLSVFALLPWILVLGYNLLRHCKILLCLLKCFLNHLYIFVIRPRIIIFEASIPYALNIPHLFHLHLLLNGFISLQLLIQLELWFAEAAKNIENVLVSFNFFEHLTVVVHKLAPLKVCRIFICLQVQTLGDEFKGDVHIAVIEVIRHRNHTRVRQIPPKAPRTYLSVQRHEVLSRD